MNEKKVPELKINVIEVPSNELTEKSEPGEKPRGFFELGLRARTKIVIISILKVIGFLGALYFFVCSLDIMSLAFRLVGGRYVTEFFTNPIITNPLSGLMIGIIVTVVVQSSSTSSSIVVTMVSAQLLKVRQAVPIIMGANIGTSVTSTLVSLGHIGNKEDFRRAFAGAILHDIFNFLNVIILLPIEIATHLIEVITSEIVRTINMNNTVKEPELLNAITKPLTAKIIQLDKSTLDKIAKNQSLGNETLIKHICGKENVTTIIDLNLTIVETVNIKCDFILESLNWPEWGVGLLLLIVSLIVLSACLIILVKILTSVFQGHFKEILQKTVNSDFPGPFKYVTPYAAMAMGCGLTILVQSSSVFTSSLVPLISMGLFSLERAFPLILGANLGTTITGILAALSTPAATFKLSLQIALCHTCFNVLGILIWYPIPYTRRLPLAIARYLSHITGNYRWVAIMYIIFLFIIIPVVIFALSLAGTAVLASVLGVVVVFLIILIVINVLQHKKPNWLPKILQNWNFLPKPLRSLQPYDKFMSKYILCCKRCHKHKKFENDSIYDEIFKELERDLENEKSNQNEEVLSSYL